MTPARRYRQCAAHLALIALVPPAIGAQSPALHDGAFAITTVRPATGGAFAQAIVIETSRSAVVIDAGGSAAHAERIKTRLREIGKPLVALLLTHAHLDHYGGAGLLRSNNVPLITSAGVARHLADWDSTNFARFGATVPAGPRGPDRLLADGESLTVDGVRITLREAGPGESYSDAWFLIEGIDRRAAVIGDLAMYGIPPFAQSGHTGDWVRALRKVRAAIPVGTPIYIGHDRRAMQGDTTAWGHEVINLQVQRLQAFSEAVRGVTASARLLRPAEIDTITARLLRESPETDATYAFLYRTSANVLAAELILTEARRAFEELLKAALTPPRRSPSGD